jgi:hypothetical protein
MLILNSIVLSDDVRLPVAARRGAGLPFPAPALALWRKFIAQPLIPKFVRSGVALTRWFIYCLLRLRDNGNNSVFIEIPVPARDPTMISRGGLQQKNQTPLLPESASFSELYACQVEARLG